MSTNIGGMVFFEWLLEDGEIEPDSDDECQQEEDGELSDDGSQFTTKIIDNTEDHDIFDNLARQPSGEEPPEAITEKSKDAVQLLFISISLLLQIKKLSCFQKIVRVFKDPVQRSRGANQNQRLKR